MPTPVNAVLSMETSQPNRNKVKPKVNKPATTTPTVSPTKEKAVDAKKENTSSNDPDFRGALSPFRFEIKRGQENSTNNNVFTLHDYTWYPYGLAQYFNDDFYYTKSNSVDAGIFDGVQITDINSVAGIKNVANKSFDYAKNQFAGVIDSVGGLFKDDEEDTEDAEIVITPLQEYLNSTPSIRIYEFQPNNSISELVGLFKDMFKFFDSFFGGDTGDQLKNLKGIFTKDGMNTLIAGITGYTPDQMSGIEGSILRIPEYFYRNLIGGFYTAQYDIPFFQQSDYLEGMGSTGWESRSLKQRMFPGGLSGMMDQFSDLSSAFDIAAKPKWSMDGSGPSSPEITVDFMLYNHTSDDAVKNINLVHSLCGGNMWIQKGFKQLAPSLYDIEVTGRYRYYFCKANIKAEYAGKQRLAPESVLSRLSANKAETDITLNPNAFKYIPDAYKMTITFQSLIPNNFNTYINYLSNETNNISIGDERETLGYKFVSTFRKMADGTLKVNAEANSPEVVSNDNLGESGGGSGEVVG